MSEVKRPFPWKALLKIGIGLFVLCLAAVQARHPHEPHEIRGGRRLALLRLVLRFLYRVGGNEAVVATLVFIGVLFIAVGVVQIRNRYRRARPVNQAA